MAECGSSYRWASPFANGARFCILVFSEFVSRAGISIRTDPTARRARAKHLRLDVARKDYRRPTEAIDLSALWFRSIASLWFLSIAVLSFVSVGSSLSGPKHWGVDGSVHAAMFLVLTVGPGLFVRSATALVVAAVVTLSLAVGLEIAQAARNGASLEGADIFANLLGIAAGVALVVIVRGRIRRLRAGAEDG